MATGKNGVVNKTNGNIPSQGPTGNTKGGLVADTRKGPLGMRQTMKQTGKPGKGSK